MKLHVLVDDYHTALRAVDDGATIVQVRVKDRTTEELVEIARPFLGLPVEVVLNDDVEAAIEVGADGVHLGRSDAGAERARDEGLLLGLSASSVEEAVEAQERGADYIGAGPVWATPSKLDAEPPIGLEGLRMIADAVTVPVVAIGGVDASNAGDCIRAGAAGVAVIRAASDARAVLAAVDAAL